MRLPDGWGKGRGLFGLPFDATGTLAGDQKSQQLAPYLIRGLPDPVCRRTATAVLHDAALAQYRNATSAIAHRIIWPMRSSSFCNKPLVYTEETGPSRWRELSASAGDAVRSRGATLMGTRNRPPCFRCAQHVSSRHHSTAYFCWTWPSRPRTQRKPVPWVCSANPPRPRAVVVMSEIGLCQDPPRIDRTTPFLSGPCGFRSGACW